MKKLKQILFLIPVFVLLSYQTVLAQRTGTTVQIQNPLRNTSSVSELIATFVDWIINLGVVVVVLAFVYTGFQYVAARGNPDGIKKAHAAFLWTVVGTLVLIGAKVLTEVIKNTLTQGGVITG